MSAASDKPFKYKLMGDERPLGPPHQRFPDMHYSFDEFDPYMGSSVNPSGSVDYHLILAHHYTGCLLA